MTKLNTRPLALVALLAGALATAMNQTPSAQASDPFVGMWHLNIAKSTYAPGPAPKSGTATISATAAGDKVTVEGVAGTGDKVKWEYTGKTDGKEYAVTGNPEADVAILKQVNPRTAEVIIKKGGKTMATHTRTVSADGKTMTVTTVGTNLKGETVKNVQVFDKM